MKIGLVGPTYDERSLPFDAQRSINIFPVKDPGGKEVAAMYSAPGLVERFNVGDSPMRSIMAMKNGRVFCISGTRLVELLNIETGAFEIRGNFAPTVIQFAGRSQAYFNVKPYKYPNPFITWAEDDKSFCFCDGISVYRYLWFDPANPGQANEEQLVDITDSILGQSKPYQAGITQGVGSVTSVAGYTVASINGTQRFNISGRNNSLSWDALDFGSKESRPDNINLVKNIGGNVWLIGDSSMEIWANSGNPDFPFSRVPGGTVDIGTDAIHSFLDVNGIAIFVGKDEFGSGTVYAASGAQFSPVSTPVIDRRISEAGDLSKLTAFLYREEGQVFYCLTGGNLKTTLVYEVMSKMWHERAILGECGEFKQQIPRCHSFGFNAHLVGSRFDGKIYQQSLDYHSYADSPLVRERVYSHIAKENERLRFNSLNIGIEVGVGNQEGQGSDPKISLSVSRDGGKTWSQWRSISFGKVGKYNLDVTFRRLGIAKQMTFKIRISDPVKVAICGSYLF